MTLCPDYHQLKWEFRTLCIVILTEYIPLCAVLASPARIRLTGGTTLASISEWLCGSTMNDERSSVLPPSFLPIPPPSVLNLAVWLWQWKPLSLVHAQEYIWEFLCIFIIYYSRLVAFFIWIWVPCLLPKKQRGSKNTTHILAHAYLFSAFKWMSVPFLINQSTNTRAESLSFQ